MALVRVRRNHGQHFLSTHWGTAHWRAHPCIISLNPQSTTIQKTLLAFILIDKLRKLRLRTLHLGSSTKIWTLLSLTSAWASSPLFHFIKENGILYSSHDWTGVQCDLAKGSKERQSLRARERLRGSVSPTGSLPQRCSQLEALRGLWTEEQSLLTHLVLHPMRLVGH